MKQKAPGPVWGGGWGQLGTLCPPVPPCPEPLPPGPAGPSQLSLHVCTGLSRAGACSGHLMRCLLRISEEQTLGSSAATWA